MLHLRSGIRKQVQQPLPAQVKGDDANETLPVHGIKLCKRKRS